MEELLAFAYLLELDLVSEDMYEEKLNKLFLENPNNEDLLELEFLSGKRKETIVYIRTHMDYNSMDFDKFGRELFGLLKLIYEDMEIHEFGSAMYSLWESLAGSLQDKVPFWTLSYADDPLSYGDEEQTKKIYEEMLAYYDDQCSKP